MGLGLCSLVALLTLAKAAAGQPDLPSVSTDTNGNLHINTTASAKVFINGVENLALVEALRADHLALRAEFAALVGTLTAAPSPPPTTPTPTTSTPTTLTPTMSPTTSPNVVCPPGTITRRFMSPNANDGTARRGPSAEDLQAIYANQPLRGEVTEGDHRGYQQWTVPYSGSYRIVAAGAQGGGFANVNRAASNGFAGARIEGTFELTANQILTIVVGTAGGTANHGHGDASSSSNGGGGGSFVVQANGQPLLIAGGGAGTWSTQYAGNCDVSPLSSGRGLGQAGEDTETLVCNGYSATGGRRGGGGAATTPSYGGSAGGGFLSPGGNGGSQETQSTGGGSFRSGLVGGDDGNDGNNEDAAGGWGGFGGGGGACLASPGGGGGYSGGPSVGHWASFGGAGGGGSFNAGANPVNTAGGGDEAAARPSADGYVLISC